MTSFTWVEWKGLTPYDLGLTRDEVDPIWHDAMLQIRGGYAEEKMKQRSS